MEYQDLVKDFAQRTRINLETLRRVQKTQPDAEIYEVTQLINSMLGLLVFPQQRYFDRTPQISISDLRAHGWPIPRVESGYQQAKDLRELVRYLRNAITHCNLEFLSDNKKQVSGLRAWNTSPNGQTTWKAELTIEDIEEITHKLIQLLLEL